MGYGAPVVDGIIQNPTAGANSLSAEKNKNNSSLDKDAFLQLLVAQMKYQDPLEPTSNTEYISQLATFSELEEMQNMTSGLSVQRATALVGKDVIMNVTNPATGESGMFRGKVDYVQLEGGKAYLSIGGELYSVDDVYQVVDDSYLAAYDKAVKLLEKLADLPKVKDCTLDNRSEIEEICKTYNEMSEYEKSFVAEDMRKLIKSYEEKLEELKTLAGLTGPEKAKKLEELLTKLPAVGEITLDNKGAIEEISRKFKAMNAKEKEHVSEETKNLIKAYEDKLKELEEEPPEE